MTKHFKTHLLLAVVTLVFLVGCFKAEEKDDKKPQTENNTASVGKKSADSQMEAEIKKLLEDNLIAMNEESVEKYMATIHPDSPVFYNTKNLINSLFKGYDLKSTMENYSYIGMDDDYAYFRASQRIDVIKGVGMTDRRSILLHVFKKKGDKWYLWTSSVLSVEQLNNSSSK